MKTAFPIPGVATETHNPIGFGYDRSAGSSMPSGGKSGQVAANHGEAATENRRSSPRFTAVQEQVWLGWWAGEEFILIEGSVVNINHGGALISINPSPMPEQPVWIRHAQSNTRENIKATVLESKWIMAKRSFAVRLAFDSACPAHFFETVVFGTSR